VFDCTVRNVSDKGALLETATLIGIPDDFDLSIAGAPPRRCRVVWRKAYRIGVEFT
jgi:PilZ domain